MYNINIIQRLMGGGSIQAVPYHEDHIKRVPSLVTLPGAGLEEQRRSGARGLTFRWVLGLRLGQA